MIVYLANFGELALAASIWAHQPELGAVALKTDKGDLLTVRCPGRAPAKAAPVGEIVEPAAVAVHHVDVAAAVGRASDEGDPSAVRRPGWRGIEAGGVGERARGRSVDAGDRDLARFVACAREDDARSVARPIWLLVPESGLAQSAHAA